MLFFAGFHSRLVLLSMPDVMQSEDSMYSPAGDTSTKGEICILPCTLGLGHPDIIVYKNHKMTKQAFMNK